MTFLIYTLLTLFIIVCSLLILVVLIQKGRGGGLASAFGGGGGGNTAFGAKTGDVLTWVTSVIFGVFLLLAVALNILSDRYQSRAVPRSPIAPVAPISQTPTPGPVEAVPPLSTDARPMANEPVHNSVPAQKDATNTPAPVLPAPTQGK